ncbi:hypothetical protein GCM10010171_21380 [Actinokineospora fastidiosa]|uniref:Uncharacterized protein n=1 Tax=Actinokineospora fastidiosa TaxID=1816 RepID=A0A918GBV8_9PSEU|nr:hypothetical protein GCM10010171_21380 [Actinokineospora fastidiosa]
MSNFTPYQPSDTCGPDTPNPNRNRPPDNASNVAAVIAAIVGRRAGICRIALPTSIRSVCAATHANTVGASDPYASATHATENPNRSASLANARFAASLPAPQ